MLSHTLLAALVPFELLALFIAQRRVFWDVQHAVGGRSGKFFAYLIAMPATAAHELAHAAMAVLLGVRVGRIVLFRPVTDPKTGGVTLGFVEHERADPVRGSLIAIAPVLLVPVLMLAVNRVLLGAWIPAEPLNLLSEVHWIKVVAWILLTLCVATAAFPSEGDDVGVFGGICLGGLAAAIGYFAFQRGGSGAIISVLAGWSGLMLIPAVGAAIMIMLTRRTGR